MANLIVLNAQASSVLLPHLTLTLKTSMTATVKPFQTTKNKNDSTQPQKAFKYDKNTAVVLASTSSDNIGEVLGDQPSGL
ncbi:hypothetical protein RO3G_06347 [Rhizopus delemar RA 99-880]|uniref:Uncharacterized protein n=1 Tax=Rhizopus delemar (strain RA 99-880 / ATCC MYA-4621 / FGSC 9543 / NRRL 43880) TaxID=246409 RepID=I1BZL2_RHIO9|nr:hypothetical protein RO3G_06347 [Rhizopus delemar RA 99-880]|eukprot:EIE81642.1 hypothetical protein RO3G_06347 [Rhizopus delemar RA 99-880]